MAASHAIPGSATLYLNTMMRKQISTRAGFCIKKHTRASRDAPIMADDLRAAFAEDTPDSKKLLGRISSFSGKLVLSGWRSAEVSLPV
jgi:hypothetical protein